MNLNEFQKGISSSNRLEREVTMVKARKEILLKEYRCVHCGRLLDRFSGQAEVKCLKCGEMNVIGVDNHADSGIAR